MEDLTCYDSHDEVVHGREVVADLPQPTILQEIIENILDDQVVLPIMEDIRKISY